MNKKLFFTLGLAIALVFSLSFSLCFATDATNTLKDAGNDMVNGVRDAVGGAENAIEDGARDLSNTSKNITGGTENMAHDATNGMGNIAGTAKNGVSYTATRTSAETGSTFMGMNATAWTWLIIGIAAIAIVALVWYYGNQLHNNYDNNHDE